MPLERYMAVFSNLLRASLGVWVYDGVRGVKSKEAW